MFKSFIFCFLFLMSFDLCAQHKTIAAIFPEAHFIGETNMYRGRGHVWVPGYNFEINFSITLNGNFCWDKPIVVRYNSSTGEKVLLLLNSGCRVLDSRQIYNYGFIYSTQSSCVVEFQLGEYDSERNDIMRYSDVRFIGNSVYLDLNQIKK